MRRQSLNTSHQQTNAQPVSEQWVFLKNYSPVLLLSIVTWYGVSLWSAVVSCRGCVCSQTLAHS